MQGQGLQGQVEQRGIGVFGVGLELQQGHKGPVVEVFLARGDEAQEPRFGQWRGGRKRCLRSGFSGGAEGG